jgi:hypothetical protein
VLQGRARRIELGYRQHSTLVPLPNKDAWIGRFVFDKPTSRSMLSHSAQECALQITPRRKQINGESTTASSKHNQPPRLTARYKRIQLTSPASHTAR